MARGFDPNKVRTGKMPPDYALKVVIYGGVHTNIQIVKRERKTDKAFLCDIYVVAQHIRCYSSWVPISQIEQDEFTNELGEKCIDVSEWYFSNVLKGEITEADY